MIAAYYTSWGAYSGYTPGKIPADKLDVVEYAFAVVDSGLNVVMGDPNIDPQNFAGLKALKEKYPELKIVISIGGWEGSGRFSDAALTSISRAAFAKSAVAFMRAHGFDGADIDWEYPTGRGLSTNASRPEDRTNFTLLMAALRNALDTAGTADEKHYSLSFAGASETFFADSVELSKLAQYADYGFLMAYDMHGTWENYTDFNAALYTPPGISPQGKWSCDAAVKLWVKNGFPKSMTVMGIPLYGYIYNGVRNTNKGLYQEYSSGDILSFDSIVSKYLNNTAYKRYVDPAAGVPWIYGNSAFISYDDAQSVTLKAQFAAQSGLRGAGAWDLSQNLDGTLLNTIYENIK